MELSYIKLLYISRIYMKRHMRLRQQLKIYGVYAMVLFWFYKC
jgi:hypothetical protein